MPPAGADLTAARFIHRGGELVASVAQEGLIRVAQGDCLNK